MSKVLFVSQTGELGGAELFLVDMVRDGPPGWRGALLANGPAATALAAAGRLEGVVTAGQDLQKIKRSGGLSLGAVSAIWSAAAGVARLARDYDVICANSQKALFICALASLMSRKPLVWILHDIITDPAFSKVNRTAAIASANLFASRIVANSRASADAFLAAGGKAGALSIVHNGFNVDEWAPRSQAAGAAIRKRFNLDARPIVALFGRLTPWKGQTVLLQALADLPDVQALIVGGPLFGEGWHETELKALATSLDLDDRVRFTGFQDDVAGLMAGCDILVHASTHAEPFGRVIVEGQLSQLPVIATDAGGVVDIVDDGETGLLIPPSDPAALRTAILDLVGDPDRAARLAKQGRDSAIARFSLTHSRETFAAVVAGMDLRRSPA